MKDPLPGDFITVAVDGNCLQYGDRAIVFSIEKGMEPWQYGLFSYRKNCWEIMERWQFTHI